MTNEKAIQLLHRLSDEQFDSEYGDERREALEMAVRALSGDGDTISRKMAIDAIEEMQLPIMRSEWLSDQYKFSAFAEVREMISELPSAQTEIIRCKECKWYELPSHKITENCVKWMKSNGILLPIKPNDYCSYAERRTE